MKNLQSGLCWLATFLVLIVPQVFAQNAMLLKGAGIPTLKAVYVTSGGILRWGAGFASLDYVITSSDNGVKQVSNNAGDFAVTDFALLQRDLDQEKLLQFPIMATAIVPVANLPGIKSDQLQLTGAILAEIMSGTIDNWNSRKIRALNPGLNLPSLPINRIVRSDASGATLAFTRYLSRNSKAFSKNIGTGRIVSWPGNPKTVKDEKETVEEFSATPGSISYVEMEAGNRSGMNFVSLKHGNGNVVKANISFLGAGVLTNEDGLGESGALTVIDMGQNWPIVLPIYIVIRQTAVDDEKYKRMLRFFFLNLRKNDTVIEDKGFVPLPASLQMQVIRTFHKVRSQSGSPLRVDYDFVN